MKQKRSKNKKSKPRSKTAVTRSQEKMQKQAVESDLSPEEKKQLRIAEEVMEEYGETLAILAKM